MGGRIMKNIFKTTPDNCKTVILLYLFFLLTSAQQSYAQRITRQYNNVSFSEALKDINARQHKYTINFVYDVNPAKRNVLDLKNETCKNREKRNVLKFSHTRHFKTTKKQSKTGCFYSF